MPSIIDKAVDGVLKRLILNAGDFSYLLPSALKAPVAKVVTKAHVAVYRRSGGQVGGESLGFTPLLLTTTGRKTGQPRTIATLYMPDGDRIILVASFGGDDRNPQWCLNLRANPEATIQIGGEVRTVRAHEAEGAEREDLWRRVLEYMPRYADYQSHTSRIIPLVILETVAALATEPAGIRRRAATMRPELQPKCSA